MATCALTQGYTRDCLDSVGGLKEVYFIEFGNVTTVTEASGIVTAITKASGKRFWKYALPKGTGSITENETLSEENGTLFHSQELKLNLNKMQAAIRNELQLLAKNKLMIVGVDMNGKGWLIGRTDGAYSQGGTNATGQARGDRNGYERTYKADETDPMQEVNAATVLTLETPGT